MNPDEIREAKLRKRRLARIRFKSLIQKVRLNVFWLSELENQTLGDNVRRNVAIIVRRKGFKGILTLMEKRILNTPVELRTIEEKKRILMVTSELKCLQRFSPIVRSRLSKCLHYHYYNRGRTILKENHHANAAYFLLDGEITVSQMKWSSIENRFVNLPIGVIRPGDMFGEVALINDSKRSATCQTATDCELLSIHKSDFDFILKTTLKKQWDQILLSLQRFDYFKSWTVQQIHECCFLSQIKQYNEQQTIYKEDDNDGLLTYSHFVLSGQCMILQCLKLKTTQKGKVSTYELAEVQIKQTKSDEIIAKVNSAINKMKSNDHLQESDDVVDSIEINNESNPVQNLEFKFMDVGTLSCGSVFGLGECMTDRAIVARNQVQCLLIPRYWLFEKDQNMGNIWQKTKMYMDASIPSREILFKDFKATQKWKKYRKKVIQGTINTMPMEKNLTRKRDIPIICRIEEM